MAIKQTLDTLMKQPMTRRQFLGRVGIVFLAVIGVSSFLRALSEHTSATPASGVARGNDYYGGGNS